MENGDAGLWRMVMQVHGAGDAGLWRMVMQVHGAGDAGSRCG